MCRICFDGEDEDPVGNPLVSPCLCAGGSRYIHRHCLQQWRLQGNRQDAYWKCPTCGYAYKFNRLWWADLLGSRITLTLAFVLVVSASTWLLGYIPIVEALTQTSTRSAALHILDGVAVMGVLGLMLSLTMAALRACGVIGLWWLPEPWCPLLCMECPGGGLGWAPLECASFAECGIFLLVIMVAIGFAMACYMLYAMLWSQTQLALERAQYLVENVHPAAASGGGRRGGGGGGGGGSGGGGVCGAV